MTDGEQDEFDKQAEANYAKWEAMRREHKRALEAVAQKDRDIKLLEMDRDAARLEIRDLREQLRKASDQTAEAVADRVRAETKLHSINLICTQDDTPQKQLPPPRPADLDDLARTAINQATEGLAVIRGRAVTSGDSDVR